LIPPLFGERCWPPVSLCAMRTIVRRKKSRNDDIAHLIFSALNDPVTNPRSETAGGRPALMHQA
jgi:hypothetical protein